MMVEIFPQGVPSRLQCWVFIWSVFVSAVTDDYNGQVNHLSEKLITAGVDKERVVNSILFSAGYVALENLAFIGSACWHSLLNNDEGCMTAGIQRPARSRTRLPTSWMVIQPFHGCLAQGSTDPWWETTAVWSVWDVTPKLCAQQSPFNRGHLVKWYWKNSAKEQKNTPHETVFFKWWATNQFQVGPHWF